MSSDPTIDDVRAGNPRRFLSWSDPGHRDFRICPNCLVDLRATSIAELLYTHEPCNCGTPDYTHHVEQVWHRQCFLAFYQRGRS
jgi:hypothetical protein